MEKGFSIGWMRKLIFLLLLLVFAGSAFGLAMGPARVEYIFKPNLEGSFDLLVTENTGQLTEIIMYAEGDLAQYITDIFPRNFTLQPLESKTVTYKFKCPESLSKYGRNETLVIAKTGTTNRVRNGQVAAVVAIGHQFWVHVPYPYEYAEVGIKAENIDLQTVQSGQPVFFDVSQVNLGSIDLNTSLVFELFDPSGNRLKRFEPRPNFLAKEATKIEEYDWIADLPEQIKPGIYTAKAVMEYGGTAAAEATSQFKIGAPMVLPTAMEGGSAESGQIAHIKVKMESIWGNAIDNVFARAYVLNDAKVSIRESPPSQAVTVEAWSERTVDLFVDTTELDPKTYDLNVVVYYGNGNGSKIFPFTIEPKKIVEATATGQDNSLLMLLGAGFVLLLIVVVVLVFVVLRKKKEPAHKN